MDTKKLIALIAAVVMVIAGAGWFGLESADAPIIMQYISAIITGVFGVIAAGMALWKMIADKLNG